MGHYDDQKELTTCCPIVGNMSVFLAWIWLPLATAQLPLGIGASHRVVQTTSWNFVELPASVIDSQYWALSLSIINSDAQVALMVRTSTPPELLNGSFTADFLDLSSWQYNLTTHILFFEPLALRASKRKTCTSHNLLYQSQYQVMSKRVVILLV